MKSEAAGINEFRFCAPTSCVRNLICGGGGGGGLPTGRSGGLAAEKLGRFTIPAWDMVQSI